MDFFPVLSPWMALAVLALFAFMGPPVRRRGSYAGHNPIRVVLPPDDVTRAQNQSPAGRRAQEVGEWRLGWILAIVGLALPTAWLSSGWGLIGALAVFVAGFLGNGVARTLANGFDIPGHGAEILVAEEEGWVNYRAEEIGRMLKDPARKLETHATISARLKKWQWASNIIRMLAY